MTGRQRDKSAEGRHAEDRPIPYLPASPHCSTMLVIARDTHVGSVSIATVRASLTALHRFNFLLCCGCPDGGNGDAVWLLPSAELLLMPGTDANSTAMFAARDVCPWCGGAWLLL